jgi:hypothetical protein
MPYKSLEDKRANQRDYRRRTANAHTKLYEKTKAGFLMRLYRNMQSRVRGIQKAKAHLYEHISALPAREEFYAWADAQTRFHELFADYCASGFDRKLAPSADRVDSQKGYEFDNLEWVTMSENSRRGALSRWSH